MILNMRSAGLPKRFVITNVKVRKRGYLPFAHSLLTHSVIGYLKQLSDSVAKHQTKNIRHQGKESIMCILNILNE